MGEKEGKRENRERVIVSEQRKREREREWERGEERESGNPRKSL